MIFDTLKHAQSYRNWLVAQKEGCPAIISIEDNHILDGTGFVVVGQQNAKKQKNATLGQLPIQEHHSLGMVQEAVKIAKQLSSTISELESVAQQTRPQVSTIKDSIKKLKQDISELREELNGVQQDIEQADEDLQKPHKKQKTSDKTRATDPPTSNSTSSGAKSKKRKKFLSQHEDYSDPQT
jgi:chromosome segregation ATPase